jgi:hypothetical protein
MVHITHISARITALYDSAELNRSDCISSFCGYLAGVYAIDKIVSLFDEFARWFTAALVLRRFLSGCC